jgi:hypothetical protein
MNRKADNPADPPGDRFEARLRQLGTRTPRCRVAGCLEGDPEALTGVAPNLLCYEHLQDAMGRPWTERHHFAGQHNDPVAADIPGNDHRILTGAQQQEWPRATLRNSDGSPLLRAAALIRGWLDVLRLVILRGLGWVPPFLEWLDDALNDYIGPHWWQMLGYDEPNA